jgi:hypothetical protein
MEHETTGMRHNGRPSSPDRVEIEDTIVVERSESDPAGQGEQEYEVVGIVEDADSALRYAVCYCEVEDEFIVTDDAGALLRDEQLAQNILEDFLEQSAGSVDEET